MKKFLFLLLLVVLLIISITNAKENFSFINTLDNVEVSSNFVPQITMFFSGPLYFEKNLNVKDRSLELSFPGMNLKDFEKTEIAVKLKNLRDFVKEVYVEKKNVPGPRVILKILFNRKDILIRWSKLDEPCRLIFSIHLKDDLKKIRDHETNFLYTKNDQILNNQIILGKKKTPNQTRIVIDAGHGGKDTGARGLKDLKEKTVNLDIAIRTKNILKKYGYNVFLTRSMDSDLTLFERSELASKLKADLFVSIHANGFVDNEKNGIETFFLNGDDIVSERKSGFFFVSNKNDEELAKIANNLISNNTDLSKKLASTIQDGVFKFLKNKKINICNRGVRQNGFRVLLRSKVPASLVEVGFLTNQMEASLLLNSKYRQLLAQGISYGISNFINNNF
ncbi:N-acetylmuramoyl-L-alanine amidase [Candidatus Babeliales bacterium]|nr:N-acetylmuramoyl-L-alanine amidase [Candidatus Babeliales bacterium]